MAKNRFKQLMQLNQKLNGLTFATVRLTRNAEQEQESNSKSKKQKSKKMNNKVFMAISTGEEVRETQSKKLYIGVAPLKIAAICPTKAELDEMYRGDFDEPVYITEVEENGKKYKRLKIDVYMKHLYDDILGIKNYFKRSFFISERAFSNADSTKCEIIDKYGRCAWATLDEIKNKAIPTYSSGPADIDKDYRKTYRGEREFTEFLKTFFNVDNIRKYDRKSGEWKTNEHPENCLFRFEHIADWFKSDFKEFQEPVKQCKASRAIKALIAVDSYEGNMFNTIVNSGERSMLSVPFDKNGINANSELSSFEIKFFDRTMQEAKKAKRYQNAEMEVCTLREYTVKPTNFETVKPTVANPFEPAQQAAPEQVAANVMPNDEDDLPF